MSLREPVNVNLKTWSASTQSTWDPSGSALCPPLPLNKSMSTPFCALYLKTLQRVQRFSRNDVRVIFEFDLTTFLLRFKRGEYRETHNRLVCWSGWTNCWKSENSQQIFLADNFSGAEWVSRSSYQVFVHDIHLNICLLVGLLVGLKGCAELVGHRAVNKFAKSSTFVRCVCSLKSLLIVSHLFLSSKLCSARWE